MFLAKMQIMKVVMLAAGFGSRLWPLSTSEAPKQFQKLIEEKSLLQHTYKLLLRNTNEQDIYVLTLQGLESVVFDQLPAIPKEHVLIVPERRNTLPHTIFALNTITETDDEPIMIVSVDHITTNPEGFHETLDKLLTHGSDPEKRDKITLLGEKARISDPALGYVEADTIGNVQRFHEKPDKALLDEMIEAGSLYCFYFLFTLTKKALQEAMQYMDDPTVREKANDLLTTAPDERKAKFLAMPTIDISTTVFQRAHNLTLCTGQLGLVDIGKYTALYEINTSDEQGNVVLGNRVIYERCSNNLIVNQLEQPLVIIGVSDSVVVQTPVGTVVAPLDQVDAIGEIYKTQIHQRARTHALVKD